MNRRDWPVHVCKGLLLGVLTLGVCGAADGRGAIRQLNDAEVSRLIIGASVEIVDRQGAHDVVVLERFGRNGLWSGLGGRAPQIGRYRILQGVCVERPKGKENCRRLYIDRASIYWIDGKPNFVGLRQIKITPLK